MTRDQVEQFLTAALPLLRESFPRLTWTHPAGSLRVDGDHVVGDADSWTSTPKIQIVACYYSALPARLSVIIGGKVIVSRMIRGHHQPAIVAECVNEIRAYLRNEAARMLADAELLAPT